MGQMGKFRLVALDLDDTLLRSDLSISFRTRNAIRRAMQEGVSIVLASGRVPQALDSFAKILGLHKKDGYLICSNGTIITESRTGKVVFETWVPKNAALVAFDLADAEGFPVQLYDDDVMYISRRNEYTSYDEKLTGLRQVVVSNFRSMVEAGAHKLIIPGDPMILRPLEDIIRTYLGTDISLFTSKPYFLEILPPNIDKGSALAFIAQKLDVPREEVFAIGDSMNDEAMLRWAGCGVAMANSDPRIKNIASLITEHSNDDDGVAEVVERYILGNEPVPNAVMPNTAGSA
ncbi:MAG: Cof-type HAD-IIB family hydrolase [Spirochaetaceae bacterium]|jgi:Cof subfamily protein (haloacid dehalogenase superfamily)|nr:Cof-type HAD-IIB family hydrolase [Spirochaetaceae bacterium]